MGSGTRNIESHIDITRPLMEYAITIWSHSCSSSIEKLNKIQVKAAKIMSCAASSSNKLRIQEDCGLDLLKARRQTLAVKFTNSVKSFDEQHTCIPPNFQIGIVSQG
ncbi:RNase H domain-containing protein [Caerostris darwini]|uniref:RNase H domain-containing protein n=1 Tax=Caerostris darwini TaxID=1538125 RepID=A0AAV4U3Z1_9ARAC|nr:RNase H domain-containing protein [Caerostris darwini]